jgi:hypothetical protein
MPRAKYIEKHRPILSRFRQPEFEALENWRRLQGWPVPNLSEAVRILTSRGLEASPPRSTEEQSP